GESEEGEEQGGTDTRHVSSPFAGSLRVVCFSTGFSADERSETVRDGADHGYRHQPLRRPLRRQERPVGKDDDDVRTAGDVEGDGDARPRNRYIGTEALHLAVRQVAVLHHPLDGSLDGGVGARALQPGGLLDEFDLADDDPVVRNGTGLSGRGNRQQKNEGKGNDDVLDRHVGSFRGIQWRGSPAGRRVLPGPPTRIVQPGGQRGSRKVKERSKRAWRRAAAP